MNRSVLFATLLALTPFTAAADPSVISEEPATEIIWRGECRSDQTLENVGIGGFTGWTEKDGGEIFTTRERKVSLMFAREPDAIYTVKQKEVLVNGKRYACDEALLRGKDVD